MVEAAQRLDELRRLVSEKARAVIDSGVKVPREIDDLLTAETDLTNYLEDRVRGQADALQAATDERDRLRTLLSATCTCPASSMFNGPSADCPTHGGMR